MPFGKINPQAPRAYQPNVSLASKWTGQAIARLPTGRLTLTTATPVTTADVTAATTLYYTPYVGNTVPLYDGVIWRDIVFTEKSIAIPASTSQMYDVWGYYDAPTNALVLELLAWTNDTTRATALAYQDGLLVKSGDATRLYLGSVRTTTVSGQTEDSDAKRFVWNYYNRVLKSVSATDATATWTYSTNTWRQSRADSTNQVECIWGVAENPIHLDCMGHFSTSTATGRIGNTGIGVDSTSANSAILWDSATTNTSQPAQMNKAIYIGHPGIGYHYFAWLERGAGADTQTWTGTSAVGNIICGLIGKHSC